MSGHSKWHTIKHKKGAADAKRGKVFTRIIKELTVAARSGGGDPDMNPRLRTIIAEAKSANMPSENIKRAIRRGTGEEPGVSYEEVTYEGYGPGGAALIIDTLTDNRNRTVGELRHMLVEARRQPGRGQQRRVDVREERLRRRRQGQVGRGNVDERRLEAGADDMRDDGDAGRCCRRPTPSRRCSRRSSRSASSPTPPKCQAAAELRQARRARTADQMVRLMSRSTITTT